MIRFRKVLRDLADTPGRTMLAVLAMAAGVFGVGSILTAYAVLERELANTFEATNPASAILSRRGADGAKPVAVAGVRDLEERTLILGRARVGDDEWLPLALFVVRDFNDVRIDRFVRDRGRWPRNGEVVLERTAVQVARADVGQTIAVRIGDHEETLRVSGTVHAAGLAPAWMDHVVIGFIPWRTTATTQLRLVVDGDRANEAHIRGVANRVAAQLRANGDSVTNIEVPKPGRHPHADQMDTFIFLLAAFGALTLALSAVLVANMIHALLTHQLRQLGVMKTLGASTRQLVVLSLAHVVLLATAALVIALPLALSVGLGYGRFAAKILNANLADVSVPPWVIATQIAIGLLVPIAVALVPIRRAARITIRQALQNDSGTRAFGTSAFDRALTRITWLPRPLLLSLRTTFHRRGRLLLTVGTLAVGGAVFLSALNVSESWQKTIERDFAGRRYDVDVRFTRTVPLPAVAAALRGVPQITHVESWVEGTEGIRLVGLDPDSRLLALPLLAGEWRLGDGDAVVNQTAGRKPGEQIRAGRGTWRVAGVVRELGATATLYASRESVLAALAIQDGSTRNARIVTRGHDEAAQRAAARDIERALDRAGLEAAHVQPMRDRRKSIEDHLVIIESSIFFAAMLVVLVGAIGLTSTLTLNVSERTRELGVLRAIGATPRTIARHVVVEGVLIALLSWFVAALASVPATALIDRITGRLFIKAPVDFLISPRALAIWLALVIVLGALSSFYPARRSTRISVREALAYE